MFSIISLFFGDLPILALQVCTNGINLSYQISLTIKYCVCSAEDTHRFFIRYLYCILLAFISA